MLIDVRGVGYIVHVSDRTMMSLPSVGEAVSLYTELLVREDLLKCHAICTIPSNPDFGSLNLAQAVAVLGSAWVMGHDAPPPTWLVNSDGPAAQHELAGLIATIDSRLETNGFFNPAPGKTETARWMLRNVLTRPGFTGAEVQFLRGVVRHLVQARRPS